MAPLQAAKGVKAGGQEARRRAGVLATGFFDPLILVGFATFFTGADRARDVRFAGAVASTTGSSPDTLAWLDLADLMLALRASMRSTTLAGCTGVPSTISLPWRLSSMSASTFW